MKITLTEKEVYLLLDALDVLDPVDQEGTDIKDELEVRFNTAIRELYE